MSKARKKNYNWPPPPDPDKPYIPQQRNPIHSILMALPTIMLVIGLYYYYSIESRQTQSAPIGAESKEMSGVFTGTSKVNSGQKSRYYLWLEVDGSAKGIRVKPEHVQILDTLNRDELTRLKTAPTVSESKTHWAWYVEQNGTVYIDDEVMLK